jgi:multidrug efflux pump subunit AcrA (membrane-fusion protein)
MGAGLASLSAAAPIVSAGTLFQAGSLALSLLGTGFGFFSQTKQAAGQAQQAKFAAKIASNNQKSSEAAANDAIERGNEAELQNRRKYAQLAGTQRASFASRGVDLDEGSALGQLDDTMMFSNVDSNIIRENAGREAWGYRNQGANYGADATMQRVAASGYSPLNGGGTLLTGATDVAEKWYRYKLTA